MTRLIWIAATALTAITLTAQTATAERVCNQVCDDGFCRQRCVERPSVEIRTEGRRHREEWREERRERRHHREGDVEFRVPGVGVEIGR
jgi:hypothetical protein